LQHKNSALPRRLDRLELRSAIGKFEAGQIGALPQQWPRLQRCGEHDRIVVSDSQEFRSSQHQSGYLAQWHIRDIEDNEFRRLAHQITLFNPDEVAGRCAPVAEGGFRRCAAPGH